MSLCLSQVAYTLTVVEDTERLGVTTCSITTTTVHCHENSQVSLTSPRPEIECECEIQEPGPWGTSNKKFLQVLLQQN